MVRPAHLVKMCIPIPKSMIALPAASIDLPSLHDKPHGRYSQYGLRFPYVKYWNLSPVATGSRRTCTDQLTGIHLSSSESFLSGDTWNDMVKHQICTRVDDWPSAINCTRCSSPSMHLSDPGGVRNSVSQRWRPV